MSCFAGKIALITGAAGGIGSATALLLAAAGADLCITDCRAEPLEQLSTQLRSLGISVVAESCDLSSATAIEQLVQHCETQLGPVQYLVHSAGLLQPASGLNTDTENWDNSFAINARAVFLLTQQVGLLMRERKTGGIVTISSNAGAVPRANMAAYAASKAAATSISLSLGLELAPFGIRCNVVSPGSTQTPMLRQFVSDERELLVGNAAQFRLGIPLGRIATADDIARSVLFLLSDDARHITLHDLRVDGGATLDA